MADRNHDIVYDKNGVPGDLAGRREHYWRQYPGWQHETQPDIDGLLAEDQPVKREYSLWDVIKVVLRRVR